MELKLPIKIIKKSINDGFKLPNITDFYIWFAGKSHEEWSEVKNITRKQWQEAKKICFPQYSFR